MLLDLVIIWLTLCARNTDAENGPFLDRKLTGALNEIVDGH